MATERDGNYTVTGPALRATPKVRWAMRCEHCGSKNVQGVGYIRWDEELQRWEFDGEWYGDGDLDWCPDCGDNTCIEEVKL